MEYLKHSCHLIPLKTMAESIETKTTLPNRSVSITFDDGYQNNFGLVAPLLQQLNIPATFFVSSGFIGRRQMLPAEELKLILYFSVKARKHFSVDRAISLPGKARGEMLVNWIQRAVHWFKRLPKEDSVSVLARLKSIAEISYRYRQPFRFMGQKDLMALSVMPGFEIGGHTVTHPILTRESRP